MKPPAWCGWPDGFRASITRSLAVNVRRAEKVPDGVKTAALGGVIGAAMGASTCGWGAVAARAFEKIVKRVFPGEADTAMHLYGIACYFEKGFRGIVFCN